MRSVGPLALIVAIYLGLGFGYASRLPDWQAPDEPAHYSYIEQLADGNLPTIDPGDYDHDYLERVVFEEHFKRPFDRTRFSYEDWQPPLYYALLTPVFKETNGSLPALRAASLLLSSLTVVVTFVLALRFAPRDQSVALGATCALLIPQNIGGAATLNSDALANLLIATTSLIVVFLLTRSQTIVTRPQPSAALILGIVLGLGFLTKLYTYPVALVAVGVLTLDPRHRRLAATSAVVAVLLGSAWWLRNVVLYGWPDAFGILRIHEVTVGQLRTRDLVEREGFPGTLWMFAFATFRSTWGELGWRTARMPNVVHVGLAVVTLLTLSTAGYGWRRRPPCSREQKLCVLFLFGIIAAVSLQYVLGNLVFVQHQGRYLLPALPALGTLVAAGIQRATAQRARAWPWLMVALMVALNSFVLLKTLPAQPWY